MKEIKKERIEKSYYNVYIANDGTEFKDEAECVKYEESAKGVLRDKLVKLQVGKQHDAWNLMGGYDDHNVIAIKPTCKEDVDVIIQYYLLEHPCWAQDDYKSYRDKFTTQVNNALETNDLVLFGINCNDEFYFINSRMNIINNLYNLDKEDE